MKELNSHHQLIQHLQLVWEAGELLCQKFKGIGLDLDYSLIEVGIAVHDIGKSINTNELDEKGSNHEEEGERILLNHGVSPIIARICISHGQWHRMSCSLEELIVALADKLWKGKRVEKLEHKVIERISLLLKKDQWDIFTDLDSCFENIAAGGIERLNKSVDMG